MKIFTNSVLRYQYFKLLFSTLMLIVSFPALNYASHIVGGDLGYRCLGNNQYEITLSVYRDCFYGGEDAPFDDPASVGLFNAVRGTLIQELMIPFAQDDTLSGIFQDDCLMIPQDVCVHTSIYRDTIELQFIEDGYKVVYQRCCRNETIANVVNPLETGATYDIEITAAAMRVCNSSPRFKEWPPIFVCVDEPIFYDHGAIDPDGDSLAYSLCTPFTGATLDFPQPQPPAAPPYDTLTWVSPTYDLNNILGEGRALRVDPRRGFLFARPGLQGQFVVGVCVEEYRNGVLLSKTRRDFQYNIGMCREIGSRVGAPEVQCNDLTVNFESFSTDSDDFIWNFDFRPGEVPLATSTEENPTYTYPDTGRYTVELVVEPQSICSDTSYFNIYLTNSTVEASVAVETFDCGDSTVVSLIDRSVDSISNITNWFWEVNLGDTILNFTTERPSLFVPQGITGEVSMTVQSEDGCTQTVQTSFETGMSDPTAGLPDTLVICRGDSINLNPLYNGVGINGFRWRPALAIDNPNIPNPTVAPTDTITYTARIFPPNGICDVEKEVTVIVMPAPEVVEFRAVKDCFDGLTMKFTTNVEGADSIKWNFGDTTNMEFITAGMNTTYTYPDTGQYEVQLALFGAMCNDTISQLIQVQDVEGSSDFMVELGDDIETCEASVTLQANIPNVFTYEWLDESDSILASNEALTIPTTGEATYRIRARDISNCEIEDTIKIIGKQPDFIIAEDQVLCPGDTASLFAMNQTPTQDSLQYQWFPTENITMGANTASPTLAYMSGVTEYTVLAENQFGCIDSAKVKVTTIDPDLELAFDANIQCDGSTVEFINRSSQPDLNYRWLSGTGSTFNGDSLLFNYDTTGVFQACITLDYDVACIDTSCQELEIIDEMISASFTLDSIACTTDSTVVNFLNQSTAPNVMATYEWKFSNGGSSAMENPSLTLRESQRLGVELVVNAGEDCTIMTTDTIDVKVLRLNVDTLINICEGSPLQLNQGGDTNLQYSWMPTMGLDAANIASPVLTPNSTGEFEYTVSVQDANNPQCQLSQTFDVAVSDGLVLGVPDVFNLCEEDQVLSVSPMLNAAVVWTDQEGNETLGNTVNISGDYEGIYFVEAVDSTGCVGMDTISVTVGNGVDIIKPIGDTILTCEGQSVLIVLTNNDPSDSISISYFPNDQIIMGDSTLMPTYFGFRDTIVSLYYEATNQFGCAENDSLIIKIRDFDINLPSEALVCNNSPTTVNPNFNPEFEYTWSPSSGLSDPNIGNPAITINNPTSYNVTITVGREAGACRAERTIDLDLRPAFTFNTSRDTVLCQSSEVTLSAFADRPLNYEWAEDANFEDLLSMDSLITVLSDEGAEDYFVRATDEFGCPQTNIITVSTLPVNIEIQDTTIGCLGENFSVNVTNNGIDQPLTYQWMPEAIVTDGQGTANPIIQTVSNGLLSAFVSNGFGCMDTIQTYLSLIDIASEDIRIIAFPDSILAGRPSRLDLMIDGDFTYRWSPDGTLDNPSAQDPIAKPTETTTYTVEIIKEGCTGTRTVEVFVTQGACDEPFIFVPTAFTPNNDGRNDLLFVRGNPISTMYFAIFNRWGQRVFESEDPGIGWDGTYEGKALPPDVYGYYLEVECTNGETFFKKGDVSILR